MHQYSVSVTSFLSTLFWSAILPEDKKWWNAIIYGVEVGKT